MLVKKSARFVEVLSSHANETSKSVDILFGADDGTKYAIEIDPSIVAALIVAIKGEANELLAKFPDLVEGPSQGLQVKGMGAAMAPDGSLAWRISLDGQLDVNLQFARQEFDELYRQMEDIRQILHENRH